MRPRNLFIAFVLLVAIAAGYRFWLRDSSLVAVSSVQVSGAEGPEASRVEAALQRSGVGMSTLNVNGPALADSVAQFPTVAGIEVHPDFPHGLRVTVAARPPVALAEAGPKSIPVAGDGTVLSGVATGKRQLPAIKMPSLPSSSRLNGEALDQAIVTGAAPKPLRRLIERIRDKGAQGVVITLSGLPVIFGTSDRADEKWAAVAATLSDPKLSSLSYLDVRVPERPAAGGAGASVADAPAEIATPAAEAIATHPATIVPAETAITPVAPVEAAPSATPPAQTTPVPATAAAAAATSAAPEQPAASGGASVAGGGVSP